MLDDLDAVDWARLRHAYGPAGDVPDLIRAVASDDPEVADRGRRGLDGSVVPFLARLLVRDGTWRRAEIAWRLGEMAAYNNQRTRHIAAVRTDVRARHCLPTGSSAALLRSSAARPTGVVTS